MWRIGWAPNNASRWQMGFNSVFKGLKQSAYHTAHAVTEQQRKMTLMLCTAFKNMYVHWGCFTLDDMSDSCALYNEVLIPWFQAGQQLENGKTLAPCPRCSLPSQIDGVSNVGQCTHKTCQYLFCCICHCESHNGSSCPYLMPFPRIKKRSSSMCSKESKKNLRRLWLILCNTDLRNGHAQNHMLPIAVLMLHHTTTDTFALHRWWCDHKLYL